MQSEAACYMAASVVDACPVAYYCQASGGSGTDPSADDPNCKHKCIKVLPEISVFRVDAESATLPSPRSGIAEETLRKLSRLHHPNKLNQSLALSKKDDVLISAQPLTSRERADGGQVEGDSRQCLVKIRRCNVGAKPRIQEAQPLAATVPATEKNCPQPHTQNTAEQRRAT